MGVINRAGALYLAMGIDNSGLRRDAREAENIISGLRDTAVKAGAAMGVAFTFSAAKDFAMKIATVRGEFQKLEVAFNVMLGSKEAADNLMRQLVQTAATTPFDLQSIAGGAKQLLAYGVAAEEVNDILIRLGDIAAGLSIPLNDLVYLYGTTMTQGRLFAKDLNQFMGRGIPLADELAKQFGITKDKVNELVSDGKIGFSEVKKAIESLTGEGGKFHNLMEEQSKTISGRISNLGDAVTNMFNEIGKSNEGIIYDVIETANKLVENYEEIGKMIAGLVIAYGTYKAALIAVMTVRRLHASMQTAIMAQAALEQNLAAAQGIKLSQAEAKQAAQTKLLAAAKADLSKKMSSVAASLTPHLYAAAAVAVLALTTAIIQLATEASSAEKAMNTVNEAMERAEDEVASETAKIKVLTTVIKNENASREMKEKAIKDLIGLSPDLLSSITEETIKTGEAKKSIDEYIESIRKKTQLMELEKELAASIQRENKALSGKDNTPWYGIIQHALEQGPGSSGTVGHTSANRKVKTYEDFVKENNEKIIEEEKARQEAIRKRIEEISTGKKNVSNQTGGENGDEEERLDTLDKLVDKIKLAGAEHKKLQSDAAKGIISTDVIEKSKNNLDELLKKYKLITGQDYGVGKKGADKAKKEMEKRADALEEIAKMERDMRDRIEEAEIAAMDDGFDKKMAQIDLQYEKELKEIEVWKKRLEEENKKAGIGNGLTELQNDAYQVSQEAANRKWLNDRKKTLEEWKKEEQDAYYNMIEAFGSYKEKELAITEEYQQKIKKAQDEGRKNEADLLQKQKKEAIAVVAQEELGDNEAIKNFFKNVEKHTIKTATKAKKEIENVIKYLKSKGQSGEVSTERKTILDKILGNPETAKEEIESFEERLRDMNRLIDDISNQKVFDSLISNFKKLQKAAKGSTEETDALNGTLGALSDVGGVVSQLGDAMTKVGIKAGETVSIVGEVITNAASFAAAGAKIGGGWGAVIGAVVGAASSIIPAIDKANEWTDAMENSYKSQLKWVEEIKEANRDLVKSYGSVIEILKAGKDAIDATDKQLDILDKKTRDRMSHRPKNQHSYWYQTRERGLTYLRDKGLFDNYKDWYEKERGKKDDWVEREWIRRVKEPKNVHSTKGFGLIKDEWDKGYRFKIIPEFDITDLEKNGIDFFKLMEDPAEYLLNNGEGSLNLKQLEYLFKNYGGFLSQLDDQTRADLEMRRNLLKEKEKIAYDQMKAFTGISFDDVKDEFFSFLNSVDSKSKDISKNINKHLRDAITKGVIDGVMKKKLEDWYKDMAEFMRLKGEGKLSEEEQKRRLKELTDRYYNIVDEGKKARKDALNAAGIKEHEDDSKDNSLKGAYAKASQESIDLLAGQTGAVRVILEEMLRLMKGEGREESYQAFYTAYQDSLNAIRDMQANGWKEVSMMRELMQQMSVNSSTIADVSERTAENTRAILEVGKTISSDVTAISVGGLKIKGSGLGL